MPIRPRGRDAGADQILGDGVEIVEAALPVLAQRRLVPGRPIFAAAADVGEDIGIARLDPEQAERAGAIGLLGEIGRRLRGAEAAIGVDERRHRPARAAPADQEIRNAGAVARGGEALLDGEVRGVELRRQALHEAGASGRGRPRGATAASASPSTVTSARSRRRRREGASVLLAGSVDRAARPAPVAAAAQREQPPGHVVQRLDPEHAVRRRRPPRSPGARSAPSPARARPAGRRRCRPANKRRASRSGSVRPPASSGLLSLTISRPSSTSWMLAVSGIGIGRSPWSVTSEVRLVQKVRPRPRKFQRRSPSVIAKGLSATSVRSASAMVCASASGVPRRQTLAIRP